MYVSVDKFIRFAGNIPADDLTLLKIKQYILYLQSQDINSVSVRTYARGFRVFVSWLVENDYSPEELFLKFKLPKCEKPGDSGNDSRSNNRLCRNRENIVI